MGRVVAPKFGRRCVDCDDQIDPKRVRISPSARRCRDCQTELEMRNQRALQGAREDDIVIIRRT